MLTFFRRSQRMQPSKKSANRVAPRRTIATARLKLARHSVGQMLRDSLPMWECRCLYAFGCVPAAVIAGEPARSSVSHQIVTVKSQIGANTNMIRPGWAGRERHSERKARANAAIAGN